METVTMTLRLTAMMILAAGFAGAAERVADAEAVMDIIARM